MVGKIDLKGNWQLALDHECTGENIFYNDNIFLPDTTSNARKGKVSDDCHTGHLTDTYKFEGYAWYRRTIDTNALKCSALELFLERTRITEVFVDGISLGVQESFCAPHIYDLTEFIGTGERELVIRVANVGYKTGGGHMTSPDTQTNWNGILGRIELIGYGAVHCKDISITPDIHSGTVKVTAEAVGAESGKAVITVLNYPDGSEAGESFEVSFSDGRLTAEYPMAENYKLWSEHNPYLYELVIDVDGDVSRHIFGMREFRTSEGKFMVNGRETFLRGKHDGMIFPKNSYAPCDIDEWLRVMMISRSFGINHYRFHTCCPPEAAFIAADMLGIYMEPQLPFWGTVTAPDEDGYNAYEQEFLISEGFAILKAFGDHPSFCMMSMGNELWGSKERINEIIGMYKKLDKRHLYTQGSNNFQWFPCVVENDDFFVGVRLSKNRLLRGSYAMCDAPLGHIQMLKPSTVHSYDSIIKIAGSVHEEDNSAGGTVQIQFGTTMKTVSASESDDDFVPDIPIVTHEIGQYETYPDFDEIEKYTGSLKARNFEIFRERLKNKGLLHLAKDYFYCSGQLAKACYKEELESVFRSKLLAGFQILDIQDFTGQGTALVGMLDAFMDNKGIITAEEWREFCNDAVILAVFESYTPLSASEFVFDIRLVNYRPVSLYGKKVIYRFEWEDKCCTGSAVISDDSVYTDICRSTITMPYVDEITSAVLTLEVEGTDIRNHYEIEIIPDLKEVGLEGVHIFRELDSEAERLLDEGRTVLLFNKPENYVEGFYCQDFWCYPMFSSISRMMEKPEPVGTMGLLNDVSHPALKGFACRKYSTPSWWDIVMSSRFEILDGKAEDKRVIVRMIDNFERNHDLAMLYEYNKSSGKVVVCTSDPDKLMKSNEGRVFLRSVVDYVRGVT
ncbi:glycoside hydrolase family protein [Ruminococcus albus]|uniref:Glycoside hydrolase family 2 immunoglobulin domain protein beta-sandwich n=1 Tax=Ruminococcus albus (strain ATCC 27210 / DSM 20455 / JCM 14654 / NCDO 2250 / 7) TaxID=697329 RepID=E6UIA2_RUMA7|nr:glycoside hydrolase family protein [Ruminococcus albus]ADU22163.1 glycoside hydrolase family 2 immunoglobulin domain protein beta-sandwich [Ruminococcus albus 7 = DSM 20455]